MAYEPSIDSSTTTTNSTLTTLYTVVTPFNSNITLLGFVLAKRTGGSGSNGDGACYEIKVHYKNIAGVLTLIGGGVNVIGESVGAYDCVATISGGNILIQVQGVDATNITWNLKQFKTLAI